ncbi:putative disease resistance protein RPP1, partial [Camellia lanceoleosa]
IAFGVNKKRQNSNKIALEVDAFSRMHKLKLLQLNYLQDNGSFENFPKGLRWLCWHGFPFKSICNDFPLESLVVLEMRYNNLQKVWEGTKFLKSLKMLDLSHFHCLFKTPNFLEVPNLEQLMLENCARLRLVLLNLKDCKNLRKLPRSIVMLKFLETLDISGCSNIKELPLDIGTMDSLTKLNANGIAASQLLSTTKEVKPWYSFIWPSLSKPRKSVEISCALLPRFLVHLKKFESNTVGCTLVEKVTFQSFPSTIELKHLYDAYIIPFTMEYNSTWENQFVVKNYWRPLLVYGTWDNIIEIMGEFKLEPIGIIDVEIMNNLGLPNLGSMGSPTVMLSSLYSKNSMKLPLQGCHGRHIFYAYLPGNEIPTWFNLKNTGSSISFIVPSHFKIQALSVCSIYALSNNTKYPYISNAHTIINNTTKSLIWIDEDLMWLSYWKFENQLERGDELNISVVGNEDFQVKEFGVHLVYKEQEEKSSQSTSEEASQLQFSLYGNVVPGNAST